MRRNSFITIVSTCILLFHSIPHSSKAGVHVGNGGDSVFCTASPEQTKFTGDLLYGQLRCCFSRSWHTDLNCSRIQSSLKENITAFQSSLKLFVCIPLFRRSACPICDSLVVNRALVMKFLEFPKYRGGNQLVVILPCHENRPHSNKALAKRVAGVAHDEVVLRD